MLLILPENCIVLTDCGIYFSPQEDCSQPNHTNMKCFGLRSRNTRKSLNWYLKWIWSKWVIASPWHMLVSTTRFYSVEKMCVVNINALQLLSMSICCFDGRMIKWRSLDVKVLSPCCAYHAEIKSILFVLNSNTSGMANMAFWMYWGYTVHKCRSA